MTESEEIVRIRAEYARRARELPADRYSLARPVNQYFNARIRLAAIAALERLGRFPLDAADILDIGCGRGFWLMEFAQWGARASALHGIDLDERRIEYARLRLPATDLRSGDASSLPWSAESFDLVSQFTVFTSVLSPEVKRNMAAEMLRVLKPDGVILWFDFRVNNPRNSNVRGIGAGEIRSLFPGCSVTLKSLILAPPLARLAVCMSWALALAAETLPFLRTHYLATIVRNDQ